MFKELAIVLAVVFGIIGLLFWGSISVDRYMCQSTADKMQLDYSYSFSTSCMIVLNDRYVPLRNVKVPLNVQ